MITFLDSRSHTLFSDPCVLVSSGAVNVWDTRTGTLALPAPLCRHEGDVLAVTVREGGPGAAAAAAGAPLPLVIASAGVDGRVVLCRRIPSSSSSSKAGKAGGRCVVTSGSWLFGERRRYLSSMLLSPLLLQLGHLWIALWPRA